MKRQSDKVQHVLRAGQTRKHHCHWPGCSEEVPPARWGCRRHWYMLPEALRTRIWRAYKIGQEETGAPSAEYIAAARETQAWIRQHQAEETKAAPDLFGGGR